MPPKRPRLFSKWLSLPHHTDREDQSDKAALAFVLQVLAAMLGAGIVYGLLKFFGMVP